MNHFVRQITRLASAYRDAEAKVVRAFFKAPRTKKEHLRWLKAQGFKEYSAIRPILAALNALYPSIDRGIHRRDYVELTEKLADETQHARLVMDLLQEISGGGNTPRDPTLLPRRPQPCQGTSQILQELRRPSTRLGECQLQGNSSPGRTARARRHYPN